MKILIIDDEATALEKMSILLSEYGECDTATNGEMGMQMYSAAAHNNTPYDLIAIDVEMPGISGIQLLQNISCGEMDKNLPRCKKIMVSASGTRENIIAAAKYNCDCFLVKPVKRAVLDAKLSEIGLSKRPGS